MKRLLAVTSVLLPFLTAAQLGAQAAPAGQRRAAVEAQPRERISIDDGWRFRKGDPPGSTTSLLYDVRPASAGGTEDGPADARPGANTRAAQTAQDVIKSWILPTGNAFISDPTRRYQRPAGNVGGDVAFVQAAFDDRSWQKVDLPHDWASAGPWLTTGPFGGMGRLPTSGIGWYRRKLDIPRADAGKRIFLDVDGAMSYATVWLNGQIVGGWPYGYSSWRVDLTPYILPGGINQLAIRLDNLPNSSRWYPGAGLYRNVWLTKTQPVHVAHWGTYVSAGEVSRSSASVALEVTVDNDGADSVAVAVLSRIYALDEHGRPAAAAVGAIGPIRGRIASGASSTLIGTVTIAHPRLWGPPPTQKPNRYVALTTVTRAGRVVDRYETRFGIRDLRFVADSGVFVNGEHIQLRGVANHHDLGALGAAFNRRAAERQLQLLQDMGANALRTAHNPPAPELLELTDSLGVLVMDEPFDIWYEGKTPLDYHLLFPEWHEQDMRAMLRRDRNHPSIFLWSLGNEVGEQYTGEAGAAVGTRLRNIVREEDATRPTTSGMNYAKADMPLPGVLDVIGLNYQGEGIRQDPEFVGTDRIRTPPSYDTFHRRFPDKVILGSETSSALSSRGVYLFPVTPEISSVTRDGKGGDSGIRQTSAYELYAVDFGSSPDKVFAALDSHPFVAGEFVWTGFDYLGEPTPYYSSRSSYNGIFDLAGFPKDRFWLYLAQWRPELPMAHILPHWTWPERVGQITPVHVFTSGDEAELFLNGRSLGRKTKGPFEYRLRWDSVAYEPGTLRVVAYRKGVRWATDSVQTAGPPARLEAKSDRASIRPDGRDLAFVTVRITDAAGVLVPRADNSIRFQVDGPGEIVATDNGDATSFEPFQAPRHKAFSGLCLAIVRAKPRQSGTITITASSNGLRQASARITAGAP